MHLIQYRRGFLSDPLLFAFLIILTVVPFNNGTAEEQDPYLTEIIINSAPFKTPLHELSSSATVLDKETISDRSLYSFQESVISIPGLQWAGGTSAPRFFQLRGIGEVEQYQGAPNPSVGVIIDDIDYSGIGAIIPLFDLEQVEVLKGPQGIRYGSSALAGIINFRSQDASADRSGIIEARVGNDDLRSGSFAVGGAIPGTGDRIQMRVTSSNSHQDGFRDDLFLNRDDTNERDQHTTRLRLRFLPTDKLTVNLTGLFVDNNNGYDAFSIDNSLNTQSDRPGSDQVESNAGVLNVGYKLTPDVEIKNITSYARTNIDYSYDGDWGNNPFWAPYDPYDYYSATDRTRSTYSEELRLSNQPQNFQHDLEYRQSVGVFIQRLNEQSTIADASDDIVYSSIDSDYRADTGAIYSDLGIPLGNGRSLEIGGRYEHRAMQYRDDRPSYFEPTNSMWASHIALKQDVAKNTQAYLQLSRGFKGGGFNPGTRVPTSKRIYDPETLWNMELGAKGDLIENQLTFESSLYHMLRRDAQLKFAFQDDPNDPLSFTYITESAARGRSTGAEANVTMHLTQKLKFFINGNAMQTTYTSVPNELSSLKDRDYSQAPEWQFALGPRYLITESLFIESNLSRQASFYFDDSNNQKSTPYSLLNVSAGIEQPTWSWTIWAKNLLDENYPVRGFFFGNEPPDFPNKKYVQRGDPLFFGTTLSYRF